MSDCYILEGKLSILVECKISLNPQKSFLLDMNKAEINEMVIAAEAVDGSKVGEAYLEGRREKKNRLK